MRGKREVPITRTEEYSVCDRCGKEIGRYGPAFMVKAVSYGHYPVLTTPERVCCPSCWEAVRKVLETRIKPEAER